MEGGMETPEKERWKKDKEGGRAGGRERTTAGND